MHELLEVAWHTLAIYAFLIAGLRVVGKRVLGQLTVVDVVIVVIMGSAVETAMVNGNTSLAAGIVSAGTLLALSRVLNSLLLRSKRLRHLVVGGPTLLVHDGQIVQEHLRRTGLTEQDVLEAIREREQADLSDVRFAVMEPDGEINVVPMTMQPKRSTRLREGSTPANE